MIKRLISSSLKNSYQFFNKNNLYNFSEEIKTCKKNKTKKWINKFSVNFLFVSSKKIKYKYKYNIT
jgi:hypothetical protein